MTPLAAAYDNIRLIRRKIRIAHEELADNTSQRSRDETLMRLADLTEDLVRTIQDFAEAGFEEEIASIISDPLPMRMSC